MFYKGLNNLSNCQISDTEHKELTQVFGLFFGKGKPKTIIPLKGGLCNSTFLVESAGQEKFVLQKLHHVITPEIIESEQRVCDFLQEEKGWKMPLPLIATSHKPYVELGDKFFRAYRYIEGQNISEMSAAKAKEVGELLARFHTDLSCISDQNISSIPGFHDTKLYMGHLHDKKHHFEQRPEEEKKLFSALLASWNDERSENTPTTEQVIHGDARLQNFLEDENGAPLTLIDGDTFMKGSVFIDVGDLLRSINCDDTQEVALLDDDKTKATIDGYASASGKDSSEFYKGCISGYKNICLELASRFMNDIIDDCYFGWDNSRYASRAENNFVRAACQYRVYEHACKMEEIYE